MNYLFDKFQEASLNNTPNENPLTFIKQGQRVLIVNHDDL